MPPRRPAGPKAKTKFKSNVPRKGTKKRKVVISQYVGRYKAALAAAGAGGPEVVLNTFTARQQRKILDGLLHQSKEIEDIPPGVKSVVCEEELDHAAHHATVFRHVIERQTFLRNNKKIHGVDRWPPNLSQPGDRLKAFCDRPADQADGIRRSAYAVGRANLKHDAYCLRKHLTTRWGAQKAWTKPRGRPRRATWTDTNWYWHTTPRSTVRSLRWDEAGTAPAANKTRLSKHMSSQHLLYRMMTTFGGQPTVTDGDRQRRAWCYVLRYELDQRVELHVGDDNGKASARFFGVAGDNRSSNEALQLLEWLISPNCPVSPVAIVADA